jgi:hypothetical protein
VVEDRSSSVESDIPCARCAYSLRGLPADGVCPECAFSVAESVECSAMALASALPPLPPWLRVYRSAQLAAAATLLAAPFVLPALARQLNLPNAGRRSMFWDVYGTCSTALAISAVILALFLASHKRSTQASVIVFAMFFWFVSLPAVGR